MKLAIITDMHIGRGNDNLHLDAYFEKFYTEVFWPTLKKRKIKTILDGGDLFDRRRFINFNIYNNFKRYFVDPLQSGKYKMYSIIGNHNIYHTEHNGLNNMRLLLNDKMMIYEDAEEVMFDDLKILMLPWITKENEKHAMGMIEKTDASIVLGHLDLIGFEMDRGNTSRSGHDRAIFDKFKAVYSGHYHHKNGDGNVLYLGTPYEQTWADCDDPKGFYILDTDTLELEFIQNPLTIFKKWTYDDVENVDGALAVINNSGADFEGKYVRVKVANRSQPNLFDSVMGVISSSGCLDLSIIDNVPKFVINSDLSILNEDSSNDEKEANAVVEEDTIRLIRNYVRDCTFPSHVDQDRVLSVMEELYQEAEEVAKA